MTYSLSIHTDSGLVLASAPSTLHSNMHRFIWEGERFIVILASGNTATIDAVIKQVKQDISQDKGPHLRNIPDTNTAADYVADISATKQKRLAKKSGNSQKYQATFILAGQIGAQPMETLLIYAQGNFIHESKRSPFLQIGEMKYGKPILIRMVHRQMSLNDAARCALVSFDSTFHSNPTEHPIEILIYKKNSLKTTAYQAFHPGNSLLTNISQSWRDGITSTLDHLPNFCWEA